MSRPRIVTGTLCAVLAAGVTVGLVYAAAAVVTPRPLAGPVADAGWTARSRAWFTPRGFYSGEAELDRGRQFSWTTAHASLTVPVIDRSRAYRLALRILASRGPTNPPPPELVLSVDGIERRRVQTTNEPTTFVVEAPPAAGRTLTVGIDVSNTFVPSAQDRRNLGVIVEDVSIEPVGPSGSTGSTGTAFRPAIEVALMAGLATAAFVAAALMCGFDLAWALAVGLAVACAHAWLLALDGAFLGHTAGTLVRVAAGVAALSAVVGLVRRRWPAPAFAPEWAVAAGCLILAAGMKFAFFAHPSATIGDAVFQVHRAQSVHNGGYFFTSITPRPFFEFPYAIALYVSAMPFWNWFPAELDRVLLLRALAIGADALVGVAMYVALRRAWGHRWPALAFAALWPFSRVTVQALCTANLTNLYGQGVFGVAMAVMVWIVTNGRASAAAGLAAATVLVTVGFLSHFSTISVGVPLLGTIGALLFVTGRGRDRRIGVWILGVLMVALVVSYAVYYSHFNDIYRATLTRVVAREGEAQTRSMVAPASIKAARWLSETALNFGWPLIACAVAGGAWLVRRRPGDRLTTLLGGWTLTWVVFSLLGIFTAVEMRSNLAAAPLMLALAAFAIGSIGQTSRTGAIAATVVALAVACDGIREWISCLTAMR